MATRPKAIIESRNGEKLSPITIVKNVLTDDGQNLHDILSDRKEDMMTPTIENSSSMFKVGQGDNVDYSSNVVNGAYESMVLKGKTMVNYIQEPSSQDVVLPYEFADGRYVTINDTKESGALGIELKGQTLVNLCQNLDNETSTSTSMLISGEIPVKTNAKYMVIAKVKSSNPLSSVSYSSFLRVDSITTGHILGGVTGDITTAYTTKSFTFNTGNTTTVKINLRNAYGDWGLTSNTSYAKEVMLIEYQEGMENWDIPYFEGMASCKMPTLKTTGKNLTSLDICYDTFMKTVTGHNNTTFDNGILKLAWTGTVRRANLIENVFKPNTQYTLSYWCKAPEGSAWQRSMIRIKYTDGTESHLSSDSTSSTDFARQILVSEPNKTVESVYVDLNNVLYINQIQLEESTTATPYEPYKSSILSLPEEVVLRGLPNGVRDTFNTRTGVYTQNCIELIYDGETNSGANISISAAGTTENTNSFSLHLPSLGLDTAGGVCDCLKIVGLDDDEKGIVFGRGGAGNVFIKTDKTIATIAQLKEWLKNNNIRVVVRTTSIVTKINLPSTLKSWNTTTHIYSKISENSLYPILSHSNPSYPVILKPSTKYSIAANSYSNGHTNSAINFNLGGATASTTVGNRVTTITTPSTLSNELLTMSGRGNKLNNVMVIEGDVVGDEPYFEGICDCKSPILSNVGGKDLNTSKSFPYQGTSVNFNINNIVAGKTYYIYVDVESYNDANLPVIGIVNQEGNNWNTKMVNIPLGKSWIKLTTSTTNTISNVLRLHKKDGLNDWIYVNNIMVFEEEDYKSNILSANGDKIELTEDMFEQGGVYFTKGQSFANATNNTASDRIRLKTLLNLKPNTTYRIAIDNAHKVGVQLYNNEKLAVSDTGWVSDATFTTKGGEKAVALVIRKLSSTANISMSDFKNIKLQLSEVDKTIVLRSLPNGVCDTLNVETGEYVQRIGEVVLDGSENWTLKDSQTKTNTMLFQINSYPQMTNELVHVLTCEFVGVNANEQWGSDIESISLNKGGNMGIRIKKTKLQSLDVTGFKQYLQANPITVQYELATPVTATIDLQGFPYAYANGHVILSSGSIEQSLTPKVEYSVVTNRNGQIRSNQKMVERHQKQLDRLQAMVLTNLVNTQYEQTLTNLKYDLKNVREEVK